MAIEILPIATVVSRLQGQVAAFGMVEGAAEFDAALRSGARILPAGFVIAAKETPATVTRMAGVIRQQVVDYFDVVYAVRDVSSRSGAEAIDGGLRALRLATLQALIGWEPSPAFGACEHDGGALVSITNGTIWWKDRIKTNHYNTV